MNDNKNQNQPNPAASDYQKILDEYAASVKPDTAQPPENLPEEKVPVDSLKETVSLPPEPKKITAETPEKSLVDDLEEAMSQKKPSESDIPPQPSLKNIDTPKIEPPIHPSLAVNLEENDTIEQKPIVTPNVSIPKIEKPADTVSEPIKTPIAEIQNSEPEITPPEKTPEEIKAEINRLLTDDETKSDTSNTATPTKKSSVGKVFFIFALILFLAVTTGLAYFLFLVPSNTNNANKNTTDSVPTNSITPTTAPADTSGTCELNDKTYQVGESFQSADGCNTCSCSADGVIACTEKACTSTTVTPATKSATTSSIPKDWKTYSSKELSLSFRYPTSWGEPKLEVVDYDAKGGPFSGKAVWINFKKSYLSGTRNIISIIGVNKNYKNYIDIDSYIGDQENLDLPETFNQQKENVYFTKKMTVASQKTAIKTSLDYMPEASGVLVQSTTKLNGKNEYTGITVKATYSNFNQTLDKYYDAGENKGLEPAAIKILTGLKDGTSQDKDMENLYKDYQTFLSTLEFN